MQKWLLHQAATSTTYITVAAIEHRKLVCMFGPWLFGQFILYWHEIIPRNYIVSVPAGCTLNHWGLRDDGV